MDAMCLSPKDKGIREGDSGIKIVGLDDVAL